MRAESGWVGEGGGGVQLLSVCGTERSDSAGVQMRRGDVIFGHDPAGSCVAGEGKIDLTVTGMMFRFKITQVKKNSFISALQWGCFKIK